MSQSKIKLNKTLKFSYIVFTTLYIVLFPFLLWGSLLSGMVFDNPHMRQFFGGSIIFSVFSIPLSIPPSIYYLWKNHSKGNNKKALFYCFLPLLVLIVVCGVTTALSLTNDYVVSRGLLTP